MARINTNVSALTARRHLNLAYRGLDSTMQHLSTGLRISRGKDDPAGLIVSERLRTEVANANQAISNTERAKLIVATAEGSLDEVANLLKDIQSKIIEAANEGAFSEDEMKANQLQIDSAIDSITRIANTSSFAGRKLLDGSLQYDTSGLDMGHIVGTQIHAAQFGSRTSIGVSVDVQTPASQARLSFPFSALGNSGDVTVEIRGRQGVTTLTFSSNATASQVADAIAGVADATGISANVSATATAGFVMYSRDYGSKEFARVRTLTSNQNFFSVTPTSPVDDAGADAVAAVNGSIAAADGNHITMKNTSFEMELDLLADWASNTSFYITGGGALFQVGPQVNTNMQVNMAINSVHASQLGSAELGFLSEVKTGGTYDLAGGNYNQASRIVDEAITRISVLRGRLGSFERNTLDTNMNQLGITAENLQSAESTLRDADFAYETSRLARDQILVNAGTTVLTLANQTTQSVLRLLGS